MCAICGKPTKYIEPPERIKKLYAERTRNFMIIGKDYLNEIPCNYASRLFTVYSRKHSDVNIDYYIISKLKSNILTGKLKRQFIQREHDLIVRKDKERKSKAGMVKYFKLEQYIHAVHTHHTGKTSYRVEINKKPKRYCRTFKTLKEAQEYKQRIINENNIRS